MREYTLITLNMIEYAVSEMPEFLNVPDEVHSIRSLYNLLSSYRDRRIQNPVKHLRCSILQKECLSAGAQTEIFGNISSKTQEKQAPKGNTFDFFLLDTLETTFLMDNLTQR